MTEFWDYKSSQTDLYKGYRRASGYERMFFYAKDGSISIASCHYWNEELKKYEGDSVQIQFPITNFYDYLRAVKVGVLTVENQTKPIPENKLPPMWNFILATNIKNMK